MTGAGAVQVSRLFACCYRQFFGLGRHFSEDYLRWQRWQLRSSGAIAMRRPQSIPIDLDRMKRHRAGSGKGILGSYWRGQAQAAHRRVRRDVRCGSSFAGGVPHDFRQGVSLACWVPHDPVRGIRDSVKLPGILTWRSVGGKGGSASLRRLGWRCLQNFSSSAYCP